MATSPDFSGFTPSSNTLSQILAAIRSAGLSDQWITAAKASGVDTPWRSPVDAESWAKRQNALTGLGWLGGGTGGTGGTGGAGGTPPPPIGVPAPQMGMGWLNQGSLGDMLQGGLLASQQALPGLLNQPTQPGLLGGSPSYGSIPWGMAPQDIRVLMNSMAGRAIAQQPMTTAGPMPVDTTKKK